MQVFIPLAHRVRAAPDPPVPFQPAPRATGGNKGNSQLSQATEEQNTTSRHRLPGGDT